MAEAKSYSDKLLEGLENLISDEQKEKFRKQAQKVAEESLEGFEQLKDDVKNVIATMQQGAEEAVEKLEAAFVDFQTNVENLQMKRRQQADDMYNRLGTLLERLRRTDVKDSLKNQLEQRTGSVMTKLKACTEGLSQDLIKQIKDLNAAYAEANESRNEEINTTLEEINQIIFG